MLFFACLLLFDASCCVRCSVCKVITNGIETRAEKHYVVLVKPVTLAAFKVQKV